MRRLKLDSSGDIPPLGPSPDTKVLSKFPRLMAHLSDTSYEDGKPRTVGYLWVKSNGVTWIVTLFEPDVFGRLDCRAQALDEALALAERWLGVEDAPWEVDQWQRDRALGKSKKKGA